MEEKRRNGSRVSGNTDEEDAAYNFLIRAPSWEKLGLGVDFEDAGNADELIRSAYA